MSEETAAVATETTAAATPKTGAEIASLFKKTVADGMSLLGEIVSWNFHGQIAYEDVLKALDAAGLDTKVARKIIPRNAFARACRTLKEKRVIRYLTESETEIAFQFTREHKESESSLYRYSKEAILTLNKKEGTVICPDSPELAELAVKLIKEETATRHASDINRVIQKLFSKQADLFPVRDQGGVYFVPSLHADFLDKIEKFVTLVNGGLPRFPIPAGTASGDRSVRDSVANGLKSMIDEHVSAIDEWDIDTSERIMENRTVKLQVTKHKLQAYAEYLGEKKEELEKAMEAASAKLLAKVEGRVESDDDESEKASDELPTDDAGEADDAADSEAEPELEAAAPAV